MLTQMRRGANTWLARGLIMFLGISFGAWGINGIFRFVADKPIALAGSAKIRPSEFAIEFDREIKRMRRTAGPTFDANAAKAMGLPTELLRQMITNALFDQEAARLGLVIPDSAVIEKIHQAPAFQGPGGFDRIAFDTLLRMNDFSEGAFIQNVRRDLLRQQLLAPMLSVPPAPVSVAEPLYRRIREERIADYVVLTPAAAGAIASPDLATLEAYYKANAARFTKPEYRKLTALKLDPKELSAHIEVPQDEIKADYDSHPERYTQVEKRQVDQFVVSDAAKAQEADKSLKAGADFAAVAKEFAGLAANELSLGEVAKTELPPEAADPIFEAKPNVVVGPVESALGTIFARVTAVAPGSVKSLDSVRGEIRDRIALEKAKDQLYDYSRQIEDKHAAGTEIAAIGKDLGLSTIAIAAVDQSGADPQGNRVAALGSDPKILSEAFATDQGQATDLTEANDGVQYIVQVDAVTQATLKPLEEVKGQVIAAWTAEARDKRLAELAAEDADKVRHGAELSKFGKVATSQPLARTETNAALGGQAIQQLFAVKQGDVFTAAAPAGAGQIIARLARVLPVDLVAEAARLARAESELGRAIGDDEIAQYENVLRERYGVTINQEAVARALGGSPS